LHFRIFEFWRLTAALLVMIFHFLRSAPPGHEEVSAMLYRLMPLMEMFFMISGFLIMMRYGETLVRESGSYKTFLIRRIARFYPLYLATLLFFVIVACVVNAGIVGTDHPGRYDWSSLPSNILLVQAWGFNDQLTFNYVSWCMSAEWFCYLALPVIVLAFRHFGYVGLTVLGVAMVVLLEVGTVSGQIPFESWLEANTWGAYRAFADFTFGALIAVAVRDSRWKLTSHQPAWIMFALSIVAMLSQEGSYLILMLLAGSMYLAALAERNNPGGASWLKVLSPIGQVSFGIYLIHPVIETVFFSVLWRKLIAPTEMVGFYVYWLVPMALTIVVAMLSARYFETPAANWINARFGSEASRSRSTRAMAG
jgi:peptidoglycan/LPS O-acetylase OafA/YrhL